MFLDTTVQADRVTAALPTRGAIAKALENCRLLTSTYVMGEFKQTFLHDAVLFHKLLTDSRTTAEALNRLERYKERPAKRMVRVFARIMEEGPEDKPSMDKPSMLSRLVRMVEWQLVDNFLFNIDRVLDGTGCARARVQPVRCNGTYNFPVRCRKADPPRCGVADYIAAHKRQLLAVAEHLVTDDADLQRLLRSVGSVLEGGSPRGNTCKSISDLLIALEVPKDAVLATTNTRHFAPLAQVLGGPHLTNPVPENHERPSKEDS